jgi:hypothetical protein
MCHLVTLARTPPPLCDVTIFILQKTWLFKDFFGEIYFKNGQKMTRDILVDPTPIPRCHLVTLSRPPPLRL